MFPFFNNTIKNKKLEAPEACEENPLKEFENRIIKQFKIEKKIEFIYDPNKKNYENYTLPGASDEKAQIFIGVNGYDLYNLDDSQRLNLYNTILHELIHVKNRVYAEPDVQEKLDSGLYRRHLGHFGYMIYDEYIAYREANEQFKQTASILKESEATLVNIFYRHLITKNLVVDKAIGYRTKEDKATFYRAFLDYCNAVIAIYVIKGRLEGVGREIERLNYCMKYLEESYENKSHLLSWSEYIELAKEFIKRIIYDLSSCQRKTFKYNTEIIFG